MITDYQSLRADLQKYLQDDDLVDEIPDFVQLCTERLNTDLEGFSQEEEITLDVTSGEADVPENFGQIISIRMDVYDSPPSYRAPQAFHDSDRLDSPPGRPLMCTIENLKFKVRPTPDKTANAIIIHKSELAQLVNDTDTNSILQRHSGLYLYGSLLASEPRVGNDPRMSTWATLYQERLDAVNKENRRKRFPRGNLRMTMSVRPARIGRPRTAQPSS